MKVSHHGIFLALYPLYLEIITCQIQPPYLHTSREEMLDMEKFIIIYIIVIIITTIIIIIFVIIIDRIFINKIVIGNIKFTYEEEKYSKISFLDNSISRNNNTLETSVFFKSTITTISYTNFNGFLPTEYKRGFLHTLLYRTYNICSSHFQIHEQINHLK